MAHGIVVVAEQEEAVPKSSKLAKYAKYFVAYKIGMFFGYAKFLYGKAAIGYLAAKYPLVSSAVAASTKVWAHVTLAVSAVVAAATS